MARSSGRILMAALEESGLEPFCYEPLAIMIAITHLDTRNPYDDLMTTSGLTGDETAG